MKEVQDLLKGLLSALDEASVSIEEAPDFNRKHEILVTIDSAWNEISFELSNLS